MRERKKGQLPRCSSQIYLGAQAPRRLQLLLCQKICALAGPRNMRTHTNAHVYMKSNRDRYSAFIFCILDKMPKKELTCAAVNICFCFLPITVAVVLYISPIYHAVSLLSHPSPHKSTIDPSHSSDECNLLSNGHILQIKV